LPIAVKKRFSVRRESMQLTARQREFARIAGWALPVSVILGAVFGHFNSAPNNSVWPYIQGAIAAIVISCTILLLELVDAHTSFS
jgi:hypothetical protein